jgi:hypothetical protein
VQKRARPENTERNLPLASLPASSRVALGAGDDLCVDLDLLGADLDLDARMRDEVVEPVGIVRRAGARRRPSFAGLAV